MQVKVFKWVFFKKFYKWRQYQWKKENLGPISEDLNQRDFYDDQKGTITTHKMSGKGSQKWLMSHSGLHNEAIQRELIKHIQSLTEKNANATIMKMDLSYFG